MKNKLIQVVDYIDNNTELKTAVEVLETVIYILVAGIVLTAFGCIMAVL
jgi:hypothetical protein